MYEGVSGVSDKRTVCKSGVSVMSDETVDIPFSMKFIFSVKQFVLIF